MLFLKHGLPLIGKAPAAALPIAPLPYTGVRRLPLSLTGEADTANFKPDTLLQTGDILFADTNDFPTRAPFAGRLTGYEPVNHPLYGELICAVVAPVEDAPAAQETPSEQIPPAEIARRAGIVDELDGQPLYQKLAAAVGTHCRVVADAVEAEPFSSSAYAVLCEQSEAVRGGLALAAQAADAVGSHIAVCPPDAAAKKILKQKYSKSELYFTRRRYPVTVYAKDADPVLRVGVQALTALYTAAHTGSIPADAVVTVAGDAIASPRNLRVPLGTPVQALLEACGLQGEPAAVVAGDLFTGVLLPDTAVPVVPGMTCVLALRQVPVVEQNPCIGCGRCAAVCHARLLPYEIGRRLENMHYERLARLHPEDCDGCGACDCVCPARRNIMHAVLQAGETDGTIFLNWGGVEDD